MLRSGNIRVPLIIAAVLILTVGVVAIYYSNLNESVAVESNEMTFSAFRGEFVSSVNETGDIESSSNVEIRCEVKTRGRSGTAILEIVPEGTIVKKGEFICQLDDSVLRDELIQQRIQVAEDQASVIQAKSDLDTAQRILQEYENGIYQQELNALDAEVIAAKETYRRAIEFKRHSEILKMKGYLTASQLEADVFAEKKAKIDVDLAEEKLEVYKKFTRDRLIAQYKAEIEKQKANLKATEFTLELSAGRESERERDVAACRIIAPNDGMVVYANEMDRRDTNFVIEEGAILRDGQPIVRLPDPKLMQVRTKVNDSKINQVEEGQPCLIRVDTAPETPVQGRVKKVSTFPMPRRWYQAPIEYEVFVEVTETSELIRSGLRAKVEIFVDKQADVVQTPLSSLVKNDEIYYVFVKTRAGVEAREVTIGNNNDKFVIINSGLESGDEVIVDADSFKENYEFTTPGP